MRRLQGVLPIVHTPFLDDDSIDFATLAREGFSLCSTAVRERTPRVTCERPRTGG